MKTGFGQWHRSNPAVQVDEFKAEIDQAVQATRTALEAQLEELSANMHTLSTWRAEVDTHLRTLHTQMSALQEQERTLNADQTQSLRTGARPHPGRVRAHRPQNARTHDQQNPGGGRTASDRESVGERILATFHQLSIGATDMDIAHASGYSRTTVARWRKRFVAQGQLPNTRERAQLPLPHESETGEEPGLQNQSQPAPIS